MKLTYLGQCAFAIDIAGVRVVSDPYLSASLDRPGSIWNRNYEPPCTLTEAKPDVVIISHAHGDHMDRVTLKEYRDNGGDCPIAAPAPVCKPLEDLGFGNIIYARAEQPFEIGNVKITPIMCGHTMPHTDDAGRFCELSYFIEGNGEKIFFGGDCSLYDGLMKRMKEEAPDYAIIPANGRSEERTAQYIIGNTNCREAAEICAYSGATLIPSHWDLYDCNGCEEHEIHDAAKEFGAKVLIFKPNQTIETK